MDLFKSIVLVTGIALSVGFLGAMDNHVLAPVAAAQNNGQQNAQKKDASWWSKLLTSGNARRAIFILSTACFLQSINQQTGLCIGTNIECYAGFRPDFFISGLAGLGFGYLTFPQIKQDIRNIIRWFAQKID